MIKGLVSIVVPTCRNKEGMNNPIDDCLLSLATSSYRPIEVICVDEGRERSYQRNEGIRQARGEWILYLDDDQFISKRMIEECVGLMKDYDAVYIPEIIVTNNWFGHLRNWERRFYTGTVVDCVRFFKKEGCPMFDETMSGPEDADFDHRVPGRKTICANPLYHNDNVSLFKYLSKKAYYCRSMEQYRKRWPADKVLDWKYRCFGIFTEKGKWKWLIRKPHYTALLAGLIFARGILYLLRKR
jgi:glycosyltransferase involved in cell wall biosynthesis